MKFHEHHIFLLHIFYAIRRIFDSIIHPYSESSDRGGAVILTHVIKNFPFFGHFAENGTLCKIIQLIHLFQHLLFIVISEAGLQKFFYFVRKSFLRIDCPFIVVLFPAAVFLTHRNGNSVVIDVVRKNSRFPTDKNAFKVGKHADALTAEGGTDDWGEVVTR